MWDNLTVSVGGTLLNVDRTTTPDYILNVVDFGNTISSFDTLVNYDKQIHEMGVAYNVLNVATITGWIVANNDTGRQDDVVMSARKMKLNSLFVPTTIAKIVATNRDRRVSISCDLILLQSIRYGESEQNNNECFCSFMFKGSYRYDGLTIQNF